MSAAARRALSAVSPAALGASRRFATIDARCVRYHRHGHAAADNVLKLETVKIDTAAIKPSQVVVRMLAAPITPTDLSTIAGFGVPAGSKLTFPRVAGSEGVGVVEAVGGSVAGLKAGDFVVASRSGLGTWATHVVSDADAWTSLTGSDAPGSAGLPVEVAATAVASPLLAKHLLAGAAKGSVLVQNCALSTVGQCVIQYAAAKGVKTVNIARRHNDWDNRVHHLQGLGAGLVVDEEFARSTPKFARLLADLAPASLGLNATGGAAAATVLKALGPGATFTTYGSMSGQPVRVPTDAFTVRGIKLGGFSLDGTLAGMAKGARDAAVREAVADVSGGEGKAKVSQLLAREPFLDFPHALARAMRSSERKVVLTMPAAK